MKKVIKMSRGPTGQRGMRGSTGERGETGGDNVFIKVTNKDVYSEIKELKEQGAKYQELNEFKHNEIIAKIEALDAKISTRIDCIEKNYTVADEKIRGSVNSVKATLIGIVTIVTIAIGWLFTIMK